jgi:hypothetical protein
VGDGLPDGDRSEPTEPERAIDLVPLAEPSFAPPPAGEDPADFSEWVGLIEGLRGPVATLTEPLSAAIGLPLDGIVSPPDGAFQLDDMSLAVSEFNPISSPVSDGLDLVNADGEYLTSLTLDDFEAFYDSAYPETADGTSGSDLAWYRDDKRRVGTNDGRTTLSYQFRQLVNVSADRFTVEAFQDPADGDQVRIRLRVTASNVETFDPLDRIATVSIGMPRPGGLEPRTISLSTETSYVVAHVQWEVPGTVDDVAADLQSQVPTGRYVLADTPEELQPDSWVFRFDCPGAVACNASVSELSSRDEQAHVYWSLQYPLDRS